MGEIETTEQDKDNLDQKGEEETTTSAKNNSGADDDTEEGDDADDNNDDGADDKEATDDDEENADDKKSKKTTSKDEDDDEDKEPPTRKRPIDFIKERQERRKAKQGGDKSKSDDKTEDDEDDDIDPADEKTVGKIVEQYLKPIAEKEAKAQDDQEIKEFLTANPDFKPYEAKARKYMSHPSRKDVPIQEIFYGVAGADLLKIGAKRAKIADNEAKKTKSGGGAQDAGGVKSAATMTKAELEAKQNEVRSKMADRY